MSKGTVLLVDDEPVYLRLASDWLEKLGYRVLRAANGMTAQTVFRQETPEVVVLDLVMPPSHRPEAGLALIPEFKPVPVVVMTAHSEHDLALKAVAAGAWDFLGKPFEPELLAFVVGRAVARHRLEREVRTLRQQADAAGLLGSSAVMQQLRDLIRRVGPADLPALILGPSGTGKELVAQALHSASQRRNYPFIAVHCGAIPAELLESELFGHLKGSFTGAHRDSRGLLAAANYGTLFLDEVGEMPPAMQVKLLRFLQDGSYIPVGGHETRRVNVRLISATNRDLPAMVADGSFREDFYYRLKGIILRTPALSERPEDIAPLCTRFLERASPDRLLRLSPDALVWAAAQEWPGNVRELKAMIESAVALADPAGPGILTPEDLAFARTGEAPDPTLMPPGTRSLPELVEDLEKRLISAALAATGHNHSAAARTLGLSRVGMLKMMSRLGLR